MVILQEYETCLKSKTKITYHYLFHKIVYRIM